MHFELTEKQENDVKYLGIDDKRELEYQLQIVTLKFLTSKRFSKEHKIEEKQKDICEAYAKYIADNSYRLITRTDLRSLHYVNGNKFKVFFDKNFEEIKNRLINYGYELTDYECKGNMKAYRVIKQMESKDDF